MFKFWFWLQRMLWARQYVYVDKSSVIESGVKLSCHNAGRVRIGAESVLKEHVKISCNGGDIAIGERVQVGYFSIIASHGPIQIGRDTLIAEHVTIRGSQHRYDQGSLPKQSQGDSVGAVVIGENVWIGANVVILPGVEIGDHSVIGAGAVVTRSIPAGKVAVGLPAKVIKDVPGL